MSEPGQYMEDVTVEVARLQDQLDTKDVRIAELERVLREARSAISKSAGRNRTDDERLRRTYDSIDRVLEGTE